MRSLVDELEGAKSTLFWRGQIVFDEQSRFNEGLDKAIAIVREHKAAQDAAFMDMVSAAHAPIERALELVAEGIVQDPGVIAHKAVTAAIAAMGDVSTRKDEEVAAPAAASSTSPANASEISVVDEDLAVCMARAYWGLEPRGLIASDEVTRMRRALEVVKEHFDNLKPVSSEVHEASEIKLMPGEPVFVPAVKAVMTDQPVSITAIHHAVLEDIIRGHFEHNAIANPITCARTAMDAIRPFLCTPTKREYSKQERDVISMAFHCKLFIHEMLRGASHGELPHHLDSDEARAEWQFYVSEAEKLSAMFAEIDHQGRRGPDAD